MKKAFLVSLILVSAFLIGSSGVAWAPCMNYQTYQCTVTEMQYGEVTEPDFYDTCIGLCYDDVFEVYINAYNPSWGYGYLYPATGSKNLLGTFYDFTYEWTGCSVELKGRSIIAKFAFIQEDEGYTRILKCRQCDDCCF